MKSDTACWKSADYAFSNLFQLTTDNRPMKSEQQWRGAISY